MIKRIKYIIIICLLIILGGSCIKSYFSNTYNISLVDKDKYWEIKYKGVAASRDFAVDSKGNYYIAYKDKIQFIAVSGKSYDILRDDTLNINSLEFQNGKLYFSSNCSVFSLDLKDRNLEELIKGLPNFGDYKNSIIKLNGEDLYISIGAATNSGVVGPDNLWVKTNTYNHDITPFNIIIKALKFGTENTGPFVPYKTKIVENQSIPGHFPGNASIIKINIINKGAENFACGIRNVLGMDFDSKGKLFATVGGMEDRGLRPIQYDYDYLFEIKKGQWYGWPDYSGGDPINSPRFNKINDSFIIENQPTVNPPAPIYQNKYVSTIGTMAVDKKNDFGKLDSMFFYDQKLNSISELTNVGSLQEKIKLNNVSNIKSIKFYQGSLIILDSKAGYIVQVSKLKIQVENKFHVEFLYGLLLIIATGIIFLIKALNHKTTK
ncbi:MAG: PQQ-dependent sugar dehydrogenase [Clostridiaceae bacterium]|nr:PQQ-dependent sugar dehydrogenase [Clostridiaceae bacterium]